eukprot:CAMPEP_0174262060 /NCGR_PEP_ID=MMETSP0439-20130205/12749_1 /TAXON_ID=0 /ORGANISM="Stereomyxa ramosa, Strain Chinc5" /LENGTH=313 /DNA_ID=CAMNT_0015346695 /DNA_START=43 /DNA_END=984 /DNA_ORIENTATION=-
MSLEWARTYVNNFKTVVIKGDFHGHTITFRFENNSTCSVSTKYDATVVSACRNMPDRRWDPVARCWSASATSPDEVISPFEVIGVYFSGLENQVNLVRKLVKAQQILAANPDADNPTTQTLPSCHCDESSQIWKVRKDGPNHGKIFFSCATKECDFFMWAPKGLGWEEVFDKRIQQDLENKAKQCEERLDTMVKELNSPQRSSEKPDLSWKTETKGANRKRKREPDVFTKKKKDEKRMFGEFHCECGRWWFSGYAYEGFTQDCQKCETPTMPLSLRPLQKADGLDSREGHHDQSRCAMCANLGFDCSNRGSFY